MRRIRRPKTLLISLIVVVLWGVIGLFAFRNSTTHDVPVVEGGTYRVVRVVDGDTIVIDMSGKKMKVRLIGIDTPEVVDPQRPVQCFGPEASAEAKRLLTAGTPVRLEEDPSQGEYDKYHRLLAYIFLPDGTDFNKHMLEAGFAREYTYHLPYKYQAEFKQAEKDAKESGRGLWAKDACENPG